MTIHHDKLAYGRLKGLSDEMSAEEISKLVNELNGEEEEDDGYTAARSLESQTRSEDKSENNKDK